MNWTESARGAETFWYGEESSGDSQTQTLHPAETASICACVPRAPVRWKGFLSDSEESHRSERIGSLLSQVFPVLVRFPSWLCFIENFPLWSDGGKKKKAKLIPDWIPCLVRFAGAVVRILWCIWSYSSVCVRARARPRTLESERFPPCAVHEYSCLVYSIFLCTLQMGGRVWMMNVRTYLGTSRQPGKFMQLLFLLITCGLKRRK